MKFDKLFTAAVAAAIILTPLLTQAAEFDPSFLISDSEIMDYNSMSIGDIQQFLGKRNGTLDGYLTFDREGNPKTAVQSFFEIAQSSRINPKYLMVLTQKEQSLLEDPSPTQGQYDRATGYGCPDSGGCDDRWKGFYKQVNSAALQTRYYMENIREFNYQPGRTYNIDGQSVTIANTATAGLYNYTPHIAGGKSFWTLWNKYFSKRWPDGSLLTSGESSSSDVYLIADNKKRLISSPSVFVSLFDPKAVIAVPASDLKGYEDGVPIKYLNFSILKSDSSGNMYMIVNDSKRKIASSEIFKKFGFNEDEVITVSESELSLYRDGSDIAEYTVYPTGALLQSSSAKKPFEGLYYVLSGEKRPVLTKEILDSNFSGLKIKKTTAAELDNYMSGGNVLLPDGWLVKSKTPLKFKLVKGKKVAINPEVSAVYVISEGQKLPFTSGSALATMGYNIKNLKLISDETLRLIPMGPPITGN